MFCETCGMKMKLETKYGIENQIFHCPNCQIFAFEPEKNVTELMSHDEIEYTIKHIFNTKPSDKQIDGNHYKDMKIQPAEFCQKNELNFCEAANVKYVCRHRDKNGAIDIKKAIHFLHLLLEWDYNEFEEIQRLNDFDMYQLAAAETAIYPTLGNEIVYPVLGLAGEASEAIEKISLLLGLSISIGKVSELTKKLCRDDKCEITEERRQAIKKELGDVLWFVSEIARKLDLHLSEVANFNIKKLAARKEQGKINGDGDNREEVEEKEKSETIIGIKLNCNDEETKEI